MLEIRNLTVSVGIFSLREVSLSLPDGQCHIILGPTGSGKTLLLETIVGFKRPDTGSIVLDSRDISSLPVEARGISYVPQDLALFPHMTVEDNIMYGLKILKNTQHKELVGDMIETLGIRYLLNRSVTNLSGGEQQRVALVRALAIGCKRLALDEPFSALHETMKTELWFIILNLMRKYNLTIYMITHDLEEAFFLGNTVSILINGRLLQTGTNREVWYNPQNIEIAKFLFIRNLFNGEVLAVDENTATIKCPELNTSITVNRNKRGLALKKGDAITIGIRPANVLILEDRKINDKYENIFYGRIAEVFSKGDYHILHFVPEGGKTIIEIEIPDTVFCSHCITKGKKTIISVKRGHIILI